MFPTGSNSSQQRAANREPIAVASTNIRYSQADELSTVVTSTSFTYLCYKFLPPYPGEYLFSLESRGAATITINFFVPLVANSGSAVNSFGLITGLNYTTPIGSTINAATSTYAPNVLFGTTNSGTYTTITAGLNIRSVTPIYISASSSAVTTVFTRNLNVSYDIIR